MECVTTYGKANGKTRKEEACWCRDWHGSLCAVVSGKPSEPPRHSGRNLPRIPEYALEDLTLSGCACERNADTAVKKLGLKLSLGGELKVQGIFVLYMLNTRTRY